MNISQRISLYWKRFTPLEEFLLNEFVNQVNPEVKKITELQINSITKVARHLEWNEILFYRKNKNKITKFPNLQEIVLAKIIFKPKESKKRWTARIYSVNGNLFTIQINPSPKRICFIDGYEIVSFKIIDNPMNPIVNSNLEHIYNHLHEELLQLEGQTINNWNVKKKNEIYGISFDIGELFCIAERNDEYLCISVETNELYYVEDHESEPKFVNSSFIDFLNNNNFKK